MKLPLALISALAFPTLGYAAGYGEACSADSECPDPYCRESPEPGKKLCLRKDLNCALEGEPGVRFGYVLNKPNTIRSECIEGVGWSTNPRHNYDPDDFIVDALPVNHRVRGKDFGDMYLDCLNNPQCLAAAGAIFPPLGTGMTFQSEALKLSNKYGLNRPFRANIKGIETYVRDMEYKGGEYKIHANVPAGYSLCNLALNTISVTPPTGNAALADAKFSKSGASIYFFVPGTKYFEGGKGWEGVFYASYVKNERYDYYRGVGHCRVTTETRQFACRGNGTGGINQDHKKGVRYVPCGYNNLGREAQ